MLVECTEVIWLAAFAATAPTIASAALSDWRTREVSDLHWAVIGVAGTILFLTYSVAEEGLKWEFFSLALGSALILADILLDKDLEQRLLYPAMAVAFSVPLYSLHSDALFSAWLSVPVCYLLYLAMYYAGILKGGADAKCLIVLSMMFPMFPEMLGFPWIGVDDRIAMIFVPSISIMFFASVAILPLGAAMAATNALRGDFDRRMFIGYRMDAALAASASVWPTEDAVDGAVVRARPSDEPEEAVRRLIEAGAEKIWVTPMIPFIVPLAAVSLALLVLGSPLFLIL
ncbi:MAG: hypothetical protein LBS92_01125 [Candidatus Methanoplasma sp.]|jgi:preflagellin peptidase FlaK|nr:hypothetical protein [Candidatus Methanoplasma sp.]